MRCGAWYHGSDFKFKCSHSRITLVETRGMLGSREIFSWKDFREKDLSSRQYQEFIEIFNGNFLQCRVDFDDISFSSFRNVVYIIDDKIKMKVAGYKDFSQIESSSPLIMQEVGRLNTCEDEAWLAFERRYFSVKVYPGTVVEMPYPFHKRRVGDYEIWTFASYDIGSHVRSLLRGNIVR